MAWQATSLLVPGPLWLKASAIPFAVWGAYGPDMDHASATWARSFWGGPTASRVIARAVGGHRCGTHSLASVMYAGLTTWALLALAALFGDLSAEWRAVWTAAFASGWASHVFLDGLTVQGVAVFHPFSSRKFRWGALKTSKSIRNLTPGERRITSLLYGTGIVLLAHVLLGVLIEQA